MTVFHGFDKIEREDGKYESNERITDKDGIFAVELLPKKAFEPNVKVEDDGKR